MAGGVIVTPGEVFSTGTIENAAVRVCLGAPRSRDALRHGLEILADVLSGSHHLRVV